MRYGTIFQQPVGNNQYPLLFFKYHEKLCENSVVSTMEITADDENLLPIDVQYDSE
ncbi:MAG: hypothetical protein IKO90_00265 [Bacteroidales bacterium]|nr:hypothetical protein [Bacteroidales bacterium]MBR7034399.1 hypothetical protein [Bacteroidales bacterium]